MKKYKGYPYLENDQLVVKIYFSPEETYQLLKYLVEHDVAYIVVEVTFRKVGGKLRAFYYVKKFEENMNQEKDKVNNKDNII